MLGLSSMGLTLFSSLPSLTFFFLQLFATNVTFMFFKGFLVALRSYFLLWEFDEKFLRVLICYFYNVILGFHLSFLEVVGWLWWRQGTPHCFPVVQEPPGSQEEVEDQA